MEHVEIIECPGEPEKPRIVQIQLDRLDAINNELLAARQECAQAVANLQQYKAAVRATVIENIKNGTICREGANEALESWGDEPWNPRYNVTMTVSLEMTVEATDAAGAESEALDRLVITTDNDSAPDPYIHQRWIDEVQEVADAVH